MRLPLPLLGLAVSLPLAAQEQTPLRSGPPEGSALQALPVYAPAGPDAGLELDLNLVIGSGPGAVLFVHELTRNVAPLVRGLDQLGDSHALLGLSVGVIVLAADRNEAERRVEAASRSLRMARPMMVSVDGAEGPGAYALDRHATLTLVTCKDGKVARSVAFTDTGRQDLDRLSSLVEEVTGPLPDDPGALRAIALARLPTDLETLRARAARLALDLHWRNKRDAEEAADRARRDGAARDGAMRDGAVNSDRRPDQQPKSTPAGKPPTDERLRELLRAAIQRDADSKQLDETFAHIRARAAESADLKAQAAAMFELIENLDYGNDDAKARVHKQLAEWKSGK